MEKVYALLHIGMALCTLNAEGLPSRVGPKKLNDVTFDGAFVFPEGKEDQGVWGLLGKRLLFSPESWFSLRRVCFLSMEARESWFLLQRVSFL